MTATDLHLRLQDLQAERALAAIEGLAGNPAYMADLHDEIHATSQAFVGAAVTEIATFRGQLHGRLTG